MFKELPAWGIYIRHAQNLQFANITLNCEKKDYSTAIVLDDVHKALFTHLHINQQGQKKTMHTYKSGEIVVK